MKKRKCPIVKCLVVSTPRFDGTIEKLYAKEMERKKKEWKWREKD